MRPSFTIRLFGTLEVERGDRRLPPFPTRTAASLFAYLVLNRERSHARERLVGFFWPDASGSTALKRLRTALWRVRSVVDPDDGDASSVVTGPAGVTFARDVECRIDVAEFEETIDAARTARDDGTARERIELLRRAISLYRGDLLEDVYDEWCLVERERLRRLVVGCYEELMEIAAARGRWRTAVSHGHEMLRHDPLREHVHRYLMRLYSRMGNRPAALQQFERCRVLLRDALDVEPMKRTRDLKRAIEEESTDPSGPVPELYGPASRPPSSPPPGSDAARSLFDSAARDVEHALRKMRRALHRTDRRPPDPGSDPV